MTQNGQHDIFYYQNLVRSTDAYENTKCASYGGENWSY